MKWLKIFILIALVVSFMPLDAFCEDHHNTTEHHHGVVLCHHTCCATLADSKLSADFTSDQSSQYLATFSFLYEDPALESSNRPPIYSS